MCFREVAKSKNDKFCGKVHTVQFTQHTKFCSDRAATMGFWTLGFCYPEVVGVEAAMTVINEYM